MRVSGAHLVRELTVQTIVSLSDFGISVSTLHIFLASILPDIPRAYLFLSRFSNSDLSSGLVFIIESLFSRYTRVEIWAVSIDCISGDAIFSGVFAQI